ncbi:MAG TPA: tRNA pseudouridine(38-40) synthase TruA [Pseudomonadales bacterium]
MMSEPFTQRIALAVEYDGSAFYGWQKQLDPALPTVQQTLEEAVAKVANHPVNIRCAGRTDAGVHATAQTVHFDTSVDRPLRAWVQGVNAHLPKTVAVRWAAPTPHDFHARHSALARTYRYVICNRDQRLGVGHAQFTWERHPLDAKAMHRAAQALLGERDCSAFRAAGCQSSTPMRNVMSVAVQRREDWVVLEITANAFLLHMVRNIAGSLMAVGRGEQAEDWIARLLTAADRNLSAPTAPPNGLYLVAVRYSPGCHLPSLPKGPLFLPDVL